MSVGAFLVARLSSQRLPQKNMLKILGMPMIEQLIRRLSRSKMIDNIILTTSSDPSDDPLEDYANKLKVSCYRDSLNNIMKRITRAAEFYDCDTIVELLGDNPLVHSELLDDVINFYFSGGYDYAATVTSEYPHLEPNTKLFPIGVRVQVYSIKVANRYREFPEYISNSGKHPCSFIFDHPELFNVGYFEAKGSWSFLNQPELNFAVNYQKDLEKIRDIFDNCYNMNKNFSLRDVAQYLNINHTD
jgi:spore coat polysaccharide biosynthesis protein SpsF